MSLKPMMFLLLMTTAISAQSKSAVQFYDTTGATKTGKVGWTGDASNGYMFMQTPNEGEVIKTQSGGIKVTGTVTADKFAGDGSSLTNVPSAPATVASVTGLQDSLAKKANATSVTALQSQIGIKADTTLVNTKVSVKANTADLTLVQGTLATKVDSAWVAKKITAAGSGSIADGSVTNAKLAANAVDSNKILNGGITGADINAGTKVSVATVTASSKVGIGTTTPGCFLDILVPNSGSQTFLAFSNSGGGYGDVARLDYNAALSLPPLQLNLQHSRPFVINGGNVGIGDTTPSEKLHVLNGNIKVDNGTQNAVLGCNDLSFSRAGNSYIHHTSDNSSSIFIQAGMSLNNKLGVNEYGVRIGNAVAAGNNSGDPILQVDGTIRACATDVQSAYCSSDRRYKTDIVPLDSSLSKVIKLQGVNYNWDREKWPQKNFSEGKQIGFIAQDMEKIVPEVVNTDKDGYKSLSYDKLTALLVEAVKEQQKEILELKNEIKDLKSLKK